ncbi:RadC family protein [Candidatus Neomarinimicrobiota bacterium]
MDGVDLARVSDDDLRRAYQSRFRVNAGEVLCDSRQVVDHLSIYLDGRRSEAFVVIYLNSRNAVITTMVMAEGTVNQAAVYPREIIRQALLLDASALIVSHNHPSGQINPSEDDRRITRKIRQACEAMDLVLHDHVIVADGEWFSFADMGLF